MGGSKPAAGHVFVVKADVTTMTCDAWLCPTDQGFSITADFAPALGLGAPRKLSGYDWKRRKAIAFRDPKASPSPKALKGSQDPLVVLGNVGKRYPKSDEEIRSHVEGLRPVISEFSEVARAEIRPPEGRLLRLALPLIGTGRGGLAGVKGDVIEPLIDELNERARQDQVDFVLCTIRDVDWSAVQSVREGSDWPLTDEEEQWAVALANKARTQSLVLFVGAGVGHDAGLPDWKELLEQLCPSWIPKEDREVLSRLDNRG